MNAAPNSSERKSLVRLLRQGAWFKGLPGPLQKAILDRSVTRVHARGETIAAQGGHSEGLCAIVEGRLAWRRVVGRGERILLYVAGAGAWFGHLGLVRNAPMQFEVVAHTAARILVLPRADYEHLVAEDPAYFRSFADQALERMELLIKIYAEGRSLPMHELIPTRLATLAQMRMAESGREGHTVDLAISQGEAAAIIGVSRQTLNAALQKLESEGLVEVGFRRLRIPDPARLVEA